MEHPTLDSIITAQKDLEKRIIEQRNYTGKSAALRLLGFSCGTAGVALGLRYLTGETFYTTMVPGLFGFTFLCLPNLKGITNYLADLSLGVKLFVDDSVKIDDGVVRINKLAPKVEYNQSRLKNEPQEYLNEQIKYFQEAKVFIEKIHNGTMQISTQLLSTETDVRNSEHFKLEDYVKLEKLAYKVYYSVLHLIHGGTLRSSVYQTILDNKTILSHFQLIASAFNYGIDFYSKAQTQPELKPFIEKIDNCIKLSTELHWFTTDIAVRQQQRIGVCERFYAETFS